jgi:hypothetical protein
MIRGDDGVQLTFRKTALRGLEFGGISSGQHFRYPCKWDAVERSNGISSIARKGCGECRNPDERR